MPSTSIRIARVFAEEPENGQQDWLEDAAERDRIVGYLQAGAPILTTTALQPDQIDPVRGRVVGASFRTDGTWVWSDALTYYAGAYGLAPEDDFYADIRARHYACPAPSDAAQNDALNVLYASFRG